MTHIPFVPCQSTIPFLRKSYFKLWSWNFKINVMDVNKGKGHIVGPVSYQFASFSFHINQTNNSRHTAISKFDLEKSKVKVMSEVRGKGHIVYPVSNWHTSFSFHINQTNHSWDMAKRVFELEKTHPKFVKKICQKKFSARISPKSYQVIVMTREIKLLCFVVIIWVCRKANFC